jgi:hypothetical protein
MVVRRLFKEKKQTCVVGTEEFSKSQAIVLFFVAGS